MPAPAKARRQKARLAPGPLRHYTSPRNSLAVLAAEQPDQQNVWQRNADKPKQYPASHHIVLCCRIKDCLLTTKCGGGSVVAAGVGRGAGCHAGGCGYIALDVPGGVAEWLKALAWKACIRETVSWVRIPLPPPACSSARFVVVRHQPCKALVSLHFSSVAHLFRALSTCPNAVGFTDPLKMRDQSEKALQSNRLLIVR
jgi:hypothetical protein